MTWRNALRSLPALGILASYLVLIGAPQEPLKATLQGVVKQARTGEPLAGVRVTLLSDSPTPSFRGSEQPLADTTTDRNGEFVLSNLDPGAYRFSVGSNGYVRYTSARVDLAAGQRMSEIVVRLAQTAAVSGRISSITGKPVAGVTVQLLRRTYNSNGSTGFTTGGSVRTNDLGEYRAYWVTPGLYYVAASAGGRDPLSNPSAEFDNAVRRGNNDISENYPETFFPGVDDISKAYQVDLSEGAEIRGIDFTLPRKQRFYSIRGSLIDASTGQKPAQATITLSQRSRTGASGSSAPRWYDPATGTFELPNLTPGQYGIGIVAQSAGGIFFNGAPAGMPSVNVTVKIEDSDVENLVLTIATPALITGRIKIEGQLPATTPVERLRVSLTGAASPSIFGSPSATVAADATFKMNAAPEGEFRVAMTNLPAGFYLKEARLNSADVLNAPSRFSAAGNLEILISGNAGEVSGRLLNDQTKPVPGVEAVLIPNASRDRFELYKRSTTDKDGRFTITGISPGDYRVFAWERIDPNSFFDAEVLKKFERRGTPVHIAESSRETVNLQLIPEGAEP